MSEYTREGGGEMKFLAVERARETAMGKLVGILRFALMETITEISAAKPTGPDQSHICPLVTDTDIHR